MGAAQARGGRRSEHAQVEHDVPPQQDEKQESGEQVGPRRFRGGPADQEETYEDDGRECTEPDQDPLHDAAEDHGEGIRSAHLTLLAHPEAHAEMLA